MVLDFRSSAHPPLTPRHHVDDKILLAIQSLSSLHGSESTSRLDGEPPPPQPKLPASTTKTPRFYINEADAETTFYKLSQGTLHTINAHNNNAERFLSFDLQKNASSDSVSSHAPILRHLSSTGAICSSGSGGGQVRLHVYKTRILYILLALFLLVFMAILLAIVGIYFKDGKFINYIAVYFSL
jgi:hypothetical protein